MAKASSKKPTKVEIVKSLKAATQLLNSSIHNANVRAAEVAQEKVVVYQVWCPRERQVVGSPTTDVGYAEFIRDDHNIRTGHNSRIIPD